MTTTTATGISVEAGTIFPVDAFGAEGSYLEDSELVLPPEMKRIIDRKIAISREQFRNGQYTRFDDEFMREFLEEAHKRNEKVFRGE